MNLFDLIAALTALAGALSSILLALIAMRFVRDFSSWRLEQRRANTIRVLSDYRDQTITPQNFLARITPEEFAKTEKIDSEQVKTREQLLIFLNGMEYLCLLINEDCIDERIARLFLRGDVIRSFRHTLPYILAAREFSGSAELFTEYEVRARLWGSEP